MTREVWVKLWVKQKSDSLRNTQLLGLLFRKVFLVEVSLFGRAGLTDRNLFVFNCLLAD